jgi:two-component system sensor histidine kinase VanS
MIAAYARVSLRQRFALVAAGSVLVAALVILCVLLWLLRPVSTSGEYINDAFGYDAAARQLATARGVIQFGAIPAVVALVAAAGLFGWHTSHELLRPIRASAVLARTTTEENLSRRATSSPVDDESRAVADGINHLLSKLETGFARGNRFAADASHELLTPLATSRTILQVALRGDHDQATRQALDRLLEVNRRMTDTTRALLDLVRAENDFTVADVPLRPLVANVIQSLETQLSSHRIRLRVLLDDTTVSGHPVLLRQLVENLIRNGIVHNVERGNLSVRLSNAPVPTITIENDGPVVSGADAEALAEPFYRVDSRREGAGGHGLGLTIVTRVAEAHGARLTITARPIGGLIVHVAFPPDQPQTKSRVG